MTPSYLTVKRGQDPSVNVVLMEDLAAVLGVMVAGSCMAAATHLNSPIPDAVGSLLIGVVLGAVASFIIYSNSAALVGRSIPLSYDASLYYQRSYLLKLLICFVSRQHPTNQL